jgi:RecB family exonuclease
MANIKLSATRINSFLSCKQKYWFNYYDKLPKVANPSFKLGLAVHESLEFAGRIWLDKGKFTKTDVTKILKKYDEVSVKEGLEDYGIHAEGRDLVKKRINNFLTGEELIGLEFKFGFWGKDAGPSITTKDGVPLMGALDKVEKYDDETLLIIDYKTSKTAPTVSDLRSDIQLSIYDLVARKLFPGYKRVVLALDLLKSDIIYTYRTAEERADFEDYLKVVYDEMLSLKAQDVRANLNIFCPWCDFKDYCDTYQRACKKADYKFLPTVNYTDEQLVSEWESVKSTKKILESRERELSMIMIEKIKRKSKNISTEDKEIYIRQNSRLGYDLDTVTEIMPPEDFPSVVSVNKKALESYMNLNPAVKGPISDTATTNFTTPFLASRKVPKK